MLIVEIDVAAQGGSQRPVVGEALAVNNVSPPVTTAHARVGPNSP